MPYFDNHQSSIKPLCRRDGAPASSMRRLTVNLLKNRNVECTNLLDAANGSAEDLGDHVAIDVSQTKVTSRVTMRESLVVESQQV